MAKLIQIPGAPAPAAASATAVHAAFNSDIITPIVAGITNPVTPRNVSVTGDVAWDGGNIEVKGSYKGIPVSEVFAAADIIGATKAGAQIFDTVNSIQNSSAGAGVKQASVGIGNKLGFRQAGSAPSFGPALGIVDDSVVEAVTLDASVQGFLPTTLPNAAHTYKLLVE